MRIAVVGGTGVLGRHVVRALEALGHDARALSRSAPEHPVDLTTGARPRARAGGLRRRGRRQQRAAVEEGARRARRGVAAAARGGALGGRPPARLRLDHRDRRLPADLLPRQARAGGGGRARARCRGRSSARASSTSSSPGRSPRPRGRAWSPRRAGCCSRSRRPRSARRWRGSRRASRRVAWSASPGPRSRQVRDLARAWREADGRARRARSHAAPAGARARAARRRADVPGP